MAFDGLFTQSMTTELQKLVTGRISKIHQPNAQELLFYIRSNGQNHKLLFSIHPSYARVQLTNEQIDNPAEPPMFCMFLRKHIEGGFIKRISQQHFDRIIVFEIEGKNEIGDSFTRELHIEIMGRHSNVLFVDPERKLLLDSLKHISPSMNRVRTLLPGQPFIELPAQEKWHPEQVTKEQFSSLLHEEDLARAIVHSIGGFSPLHAKELVYRLQETDFSYETYERFIHLFYKEKPHAYLYETNQKSYFSSVQLTHLQVEPKTYETLGELLDKVYFGKAVRDRVKQQAGDLERWLQNEMDKYKTKLTKLHADLHEANQLEKHKLFGELISANMYAIEKGQTSATVVNYYDEDGTEIEIPLDARKTPNENAQNYFTKYNKAKTAQIRIAEQLEKTQEDIDYLETLSQALQQASPKDLDEIRDELSEQGFMKARKQSKKKKPSSPSPEPFVSSSGIAISVGKNNKQNDYLTFKLAKKSDIWLHAKDIPGSHVVIHHSEPDEQTIHEAANLAAYFSKSRMSSSVPVDYTEIRHVKKPNGSKPGFVIYFEQKTLYMTPDEDVVMKLQK